jgi:hypothetical protein
MYSSAVQQIVLLCDVQQFGSQIVLLCDVQQCGTANRSFV